MSPSHTMSAHWGKQIYTSWRQSRQGAQPPATSPLPSPGLTGYFGEKRSMDSDRSSTGAGGGGSHGSSSSSSSPAVDAPMTRQSSAGSWFGRRA